MYLTGALSGEMNVRAWAGDKNNAHLSPCLPNHLMPLSAQDYKADRGGIQTLIFREDIRSLEE